MNDLKRWVRVRLPSVLLKKQSNKNLSSECMKTKGFFCHIVTCLPYFLRCFKSKFSLLEMKFKNKNKCLG